MSYEFVRSSEPIQEIPPGSWGVTKRDGQSLVKISCPACGFVAALCEHIVEPTGAINPSIVCTDCGWHDTGRLEGWVNGCRAVSPNALHGQ